MLNIAILASGSGTNCQAIIDKAREGVLQARVSLVASNRPEAMALQRAQACGIPALALDHTLYASREAFDLAMLDLLEGYACDLIVLAGYMRLLSPVFIRRYEGRIVNIHPALLPAFPGTSGIGDALDYGVRLTGPSVHFVEEKMDSGPLIIQAATPVRQDDTEDSLAGRIHKLEHRIYPQAIQWIAQGRLETRGRKVLLKPSPAPLAETAGFLVWPPLEAGF